MKFPFNPRFNKLAAAWVVAPLAAGVLPIAHAAAVSSAPEVRSEVRTVIIDGDSVVENGHGNAEVVIAQSGTGGNKKELKVITTGPSFNLPDLPDVNVIVSHAMSDAFSGALTMPMAKSIKNAPYSAEVISEKVQTLPDGNQINRKTSTMAYRDSAGRTRQETRDAGGEIRSVHINDTVEGTRYVLSPSKKSASKIGVDKDLQKRIEEIREKAKAMARDGKVHIIERGNPGEEIIIKRQI